MHLWGDFTRFRARRSTRPDVHPAQTVLSLRARLSLSIALNILLLLVVWRWHGC